MQQTDTLEEILYDACDLLGLLVEDLSEFKPDCAFTYRLDYNEITARINKLKLKQANKMSDKTYSPLRKDRFGLIDGDILLYASGFAADKEQFDAKDAVKVLDDMIMNIRFMVDLSGCRIFLSDSLENNFRNKIAVSYPYKAGRSDKPKPTHYPVLKEHIIDYWEAETVKNAEADDGLGKNQTQSTLLCSIDKDLDMITGWHYNWKHSRIYHIDTLEAQRHFWTQMLTGDSTDNIKGIPRIGPVKAKKILADCDCEFHMYCKVVKEYSDNLGDKARQRFEENYDLLMIKGAPVNFRDIPIYEQKPIVQNWA